MTHVRRLSAVMAILAVAALFTVTAVGGGPGKDGRKNLLEQEDRKPLSADYQASRVGSNLAIFDFNRNVFSLILSWTY